MVELWRKVLNLYGWTEEQQCYSEEECQQNWEKSCEYVEHGMEYW